MIRENIKKAHEKLNCDERNLATFYREVVVKPSFYLPVLVLCIVAYLPSLTNTKRQFEDFHVEYYLGNNGVMKTGRWWMWLLGRSFNLAGNDILNKYFGFVLLILGALVICCTFYCLSNDNAIFKYSVLTATIVTFPLINEIWSYNVANLLVCMNFFLCGVVVYLYLHSRGNKKRIFGLSAVAFALISSSYESGLLLYVTYVLLLLWYAQYKHRINFKEFLFSGVILALPLFVGTVIGILVGRCIAIISGMPYERHGNTVSHWNDPNALQSVLIDNLDKYILRSLVYMPITLFSIAVFVWIIVLVKMMIKHSYCVCITGAIAFFSLFILSLYQGTSLAYRVAQNVTLFTAVSFFVIAEYANKHCTVMRRVINLLLLITCISEAACLCDINLRDYQSAHNDENLVRQIGFELTSHYYGKPVIFVGHLYDGYTIYSEYLQERVIVDTSSPMGKIYNKLHIYCYGYSAENMKYHETNLWSVLFLADRESASMEQFFSYCGYQISVIPYADNPDAYPEVKDLVESNGIHILEFADMGEYVVVGL